MTRRYNKNTVSYTTDQEEFKELNPEQQERLQQQRQQAQQQQRNGGSGRALIFFLIVLLSLVELLLVAYFLHKWFHLSDDLFDALTEYAKKKSNFI